MVRIPFNINCSYFVYTRKTWYFIGRRVKVDFTSTKFRCWFLAKKKRGSCVHIHEERQKNKVLPQYRSTSPFCYSSTCSSPAPTAVKPVRSLPTFYIPRRNRGQQRAVYPHPRPSVRRHGWQLGGRTGRGVHTHSPRRARCQRRTTRRCVHLAQPCRRGLHRKAYASLRAAAVLNESRGSSSRPYQYVHENPCIVAQRMKPVDCGEHSILRIPKVDCYGHNSISWHRIYC